MLPTKNPTSASDYRCEPPPSLFLLFLLFFFCKRDTPETPVKLTLLPPPSSIAVLKGTQLLFCILMPRNLEPPSGRINSLPCELYALCNQIHHLLPMSPFYQICTPDFYPHTLNHCRVPDNWGPLNECRAH